MGEVVSMKLLIVSPIPLTAIGGPSSIARMLRDEIGAMGDNVSVTTLTQAEKGMPLLLRQIVLFFRALVRVSQCDSVLVLDPASTGLAFLCAARILRKRSVLRIGGDFLWETYVERTKEPLLLSEFYAQKRKLSFFETLIKFSTSISLHIADHVVFTTSWQQGIWRAPYRLSNIPQSIISNPVRKGSSRETGSVGRVFLASGRDTRVKNVDLLKEVWVEVSRDFPEYTLDIEPKKPESYAAALRSAFALIIPTLSEVSPNAMLEAIRAGVPFIGPRDNGLYQEFKDCGIFVDTRNAQELAEAIRSLISTQKQPTCSVPENLPKDIASSYRALLIG